MAIIGNTYTFEGKFYLNDVLTDPTDGTIYFTTYNQQITKQIDRIQLSSANKIDTGIYQIEYEIPPPELDIIYEFTGMIAGKPSTDRKAERRTYI